MPPILTKLNKDLSSTGDENKDLAGIEAAASIEDQEADLDESPIENVDSQGWFRKNTQFLKLIAINTVQIAILVYLLLNYIIPRDRESLLIIFGFTAIVISLLLIWLVPKRQLKTLKSIPFDESQSKFSFQKEIDKLEDDFRKTLTQIIGGVLILVGLLTTYNTFELNRQGQIDERLRKVQDSLQDSSADSQRKGLISLGLLCKDDIRNRDEMFYILINYIEKKSNVLIDLRKNPPLNMQDSVTLKSNQNQLNTNTNVAANTGSNANHKAEPTDGQRTLRPEDLQEEILFALKTLLDGDCGGKLSKPQYEKNPDKYNEDIRYILNKVSFTGIKYKKANFSSVVLTNAYFDDSKLEYVDFQSAILVNADFTNANLRNGNFRNAVLKAADFTNADLSNADLTNIILTDATFPDTDLTKFKNTNFTKAILSGVDFSSYDLSSCRGLTPEQLSKSFIDPSTKLPAEFTERDRISLLNSSTDNKTKTR